MKATLKKLNEKQDPRRCEQVTYDVFIYIDGKATNDLVEAQTEHGDKWLNDLFKKNNNMMDKIKNFLEFLFKKEQEAINYGYFRDKIDEYNKVSFEIKSFMNDETVGFDLPQKFELKSDRYYKTKENAPYPTPRHLYKISHYQNKDYSDLWACYVSAPNSYMNTKRINDCFIVAEINGELKIIANFGPDIDEPKWIFYGGDSELKMNKLGKLLSIERIMEPIDDTWSMEQYNKEI